MEKEGLDFTTRMREICVHMTRHVVALNHINMQYVAVGFCQARNVETHGIYASLTPMRFLNGSLETRRNGRRYTMQRLISPEGSEYLYMLNFYVPRFLLLDFRNKLITTVHELLHISEKFDGDIRRFQGRCYAHSGSQKNFDAYAEQLASLWLAQKPPRELYEFLHEDYYSLVSKYGRIYGQKLPVPRFIRIKD
ncbi:MAG: hypothetical protein Q4C96_04690 [Planctomycetia bacterium]|nr:hypothetical protein [Planctomycetia bacterium]